MEEVKELIGEIDGDSYAELCGCDSSPPRASLTKDDSPSAFIFLSTESGSLFPTW